MNWGLGHIAAGLPRVFLTVMALTAVHPLLLSKTPRGYASGITVWVMNQADMPGAELERAKQEADRILSRAGVTLEWVVCPVSGTGADRPPRCQERQAAADLFLRILPGLPDFSVVGPSKGYAYALVPTDGGNGFLADVYLESVR